MQTEDRTKTAKKQIPGERTPVTVHGDQEIHPVDQILMGKIESPSETVTYFVNKAHALAKEGSELEVLYKQLLENKQKAEQRLAEIRYEIEVIKKDIDEWRVRPGAAPASME